MVATQTVGMMGGKFSRTGLAGTIGLAALLVAAEACAQQGTAAPLNPSAQVSGLRVDRNVFSPPPTSSTTRAMLPDSNPEAAETYQMNLIGSTTVMLETARFTSDGRYVRPRLTIGSESTELRLWMNSIGVPTERCMLPTFRARVKRDEGTGDVGSTVWMSARCRFYQKLSQDSPSRLAVVNRDGLDVRAGLLNNLQPDPASTLVRRSVSQVARGRAP